MGSRHWQVTVPRIWAVFPGCGVTQPIASLLIISRTLTHRAYTVDTTSVASLALATGEAPQPYGRATIVTRCASEGIFLQRSATYPCVLSTVVVWVSLIPGRVFAGNGPLAQGFVQLEWLKPSVLRSKYLCLDN